MVSCPFCLVLFIGRYLPYKASVDCNLRAGGLALKLCYGPFILQPLSTLRGRPKSRHALHLPHKARAAPFKQWSEEDLKLACRVVGDGWTIRRAAEEFGVPKSTLYDRVSGHVHFGLEVVPHVI